MKVTCISTDVNSFTAMDSYQYHSWSRFTTEYNPLEAGSIDRTDLKPHDNAIIRALSANYVPPKHLGGIPENTIFVARLSRQTTSETIKKVFSQYGKIKKCHLVRNIVTGISRGYAFIEYHYKQDAHRAYAQANQKEIDGKKIFVDRELERVLQGWVPRRLGGGLGGRKESGQLRFGGRDRHFKMPYISMKELPSAAKQIGKHEERYKSYHEKTNSVRNEERYKTDGQ